LSVGLHMVLRTKKSVVVVDIQHTFQRLASANMITHFIISMGYVVHKSLIDLHMSTGLRACIKARKVQNSTKAIVKLLLPSS